MPDPLYVVDRLTDQQVLSEFGKGESAASRGGYISDNRHEWGTLIWHVWREGFWWGKRDG